MDAISSDLVVFWLSLDGDTRHRKTWTAYAAIRRQCVHRVHSCVSAMFLLCTPMYLKRCKKSSATTLFLEQKPGFRMTLYGASGSMAASQNGDTSL
ncbi:hypothetical protein [Undibacterium rugosum]|uniref:Uncharacterized protein n=1 Tax=Undibacterium rugosum TaxID=2762291 RepID=A0A923KZ53_9BURK|nr:hypothetical protein [Undibacterium rugosum]MBC3935448.1 hypothetical protein [Undibacterium rugosum]MBR7778777.1 hypothetical protein [Undibacterium rugosum]